MLVGIAASKRGNAFCLSSRTCWITASISVTVLKDLIGNRLYMGGKHMGGSLNSHEVAEGWVRGGWVA